MKAAFISLVVLTVYAVVSQPSVQRSIQNGIEATAKAVKTVVENGKKKLTGEKSQCLCNAR